MLIQALTKASPLLLVLCGSAAVAQSTTSETFRLQVQVPVVCTVSHRSAIAAAGEGYRLGALREYCNAPNGYMLAVDYAPGSMKGAVVMVGDEKVVLDGSGHSVVSRASGPRIRDRDVFAVPGPRGFDTDHLDFYVQTS